MSEYKSPVPPGWPKQVERPGAPGSGWEKSAARWLFEQVPGEWRSYRILRDNPPMLARDCRYLIDGELDAMRTAYARARVELADLFEPQQIEEKLAAYKDEGQRLNQLLRQVQLVEDALTGVRWVPRTNDADFTTLD